MQVNKHVPCFFFPGQAYSGETLEALGTKPPIQAIGKKLFVSQAQSDASRRLDLRWFQRPLPATRSPVQHAPDTEVTTWCLESKGRNTGDREANKNEN